MKKGFILLFPALFLFTSLVMGQNAIVGSGFTSGWGSWESNTDFEYFSSSAGDSFIKTDNANSTGNQYFRMGIDWGGTIKQITVTPGSDVSVNPNSELTLNLDNTSSGSMYLDVSSTSDNYVFKTKDAGSNPSGKLIIFRVQGDVRTVSSVSKDKTTIYPGQTVTVTANLNGAFAAGQSVYLRSSNDNFSTSTITEMSGSGTSYSADISSDINTASSTVKYYIFTSGNGLASNISNDEADWYTINLNNNSGNNYSYSVESSWTTSGSGDGSWDDPASWDAGVVPVSGQPVTIEDNLTLDQNATVSSLTINSGATFTASDGSKANRTLTISDGGTLTNNGTFTAGTGKVVFAGAGAVAGSSATTFNDLELNGALTGDYSIGSAGTLTMNGTSSVSGMVTTIGAATFDGTPGSSTFNDLTLNGALTLTKVSQINGTLQINNGASLTASPTFGSSSTLQYNTGGSYNQNLEWPASDGPYNVTVINSSLSMQNDRGASGTLEIQSSGQINLGSTTLTISSGGTLTNNGTFTASDGKVVFAGAGTVAGSNGTTFNNVELNGVLTATTAPVIEGTLTLNSGGSISTNSPSFGSEATLVYNQGGDLSPSLEWPDSNSPTNIEIKNSTNLSLTSSKNISGNLTVTSGVLKSTGVNSITMNGSNQIITISNATGGAIFGTDNDPGNDLSLIINNGSITTLTGDATTDEDDEKKFYNVTVNSGGTLALSRGILCKYGTFTVNGTLQINASGYVQSSPGGDAKPASYSSGTLVYNNGGPYTSTDYEWPTTNAPTNLILQNGGTNVTLNNAKSIAGNVTVETGTTLTSSGNLTLLSDASGTASLIVDGTVTGDVTVERYLSQDIFHYISSPINYTSGTFADLNLGLASGDDFRRYETSSNLWIDILNGPDGVFGNSDDLMDDETFQQGMGYAIAYAGENKTLSLTGSANNGDINVNVLSGGVGNNSGFNLVGNPYPSTIQASAFLSANNSTNGTINQRISGTLYFWDEPGSGDFGKSDYATRTESAGNPGGGNKTPSDFIDPGQGFFVRAVSTGNIAFRNNQRVHGTSVFFKNQSENKDFKLSVQHLETMDQNTITVVFDENSTEGFDDLYDAAKVQGNPDLALYSVVENTKLAINALPQMKEGSLVSIGLKAQIAGTYKFSVHTMENFEPGTPVVLEDRVTGIQTDLSVNPGYTFTIDAPGTYDNRFVLYFKSAVGISSPAPLQKPLVNFINGELLVTHVAEGKVDVRVVDITGRVVAMQKFQSADAVHLPLNVRTGIYIVEVAAENGKFANKIYVE